MSLTIPNDETTWLSEAFSLPQAVDFAILAAACGPRPTGVLWGCRAYWDGSSTIHVDPGTVLLDGAFAMTPTTPVDCTSDVLSRIDLIQVIPVAESVASVQIKSGAYSETPRAPLPDPGCAGVAVVYVPGKVNDYFPPLGPEFVLDKRVFLPGTVRRSKKVDESRSTLTATDDDYLALPIPKGHVTHVTIKVWYNTNATADFIWSLVLRDGNGVSFAPPTVLVNYQYTRPTVVTLVAPVFSSSLPSGISVNASGTGDAWLLIDAAIGGDATRDGVLKFQWATTGAGAAILRGSSYAIARGQGWA
jgi:hypothetical protein